VGSKERHYSQERTHSKALDLEFPREYSVLPLAMTHLAECWAVKRVKCWEVQGFVVKQQTK
jgi:hypothetical protein